MPKSMTLNVRQLQQAYHEIGFLQGTFSWLLAVVASALSVASILPSLTALVFFGFVQAGTVVFRAVRFAFTRPHVASLFFFLPSVLGSFWTELLYHTWNHLIFADTVAQPGPDPGAFTTRHRTRTPILPLC